MTFGDTVRYSRSSARGFGAVLSRVLKQKRFYQKGRYSAVSRAWEEVAGPEIASRTRIASYEDGKLRVEVESSVLLQELSGFMRETILEELRRTSGGEDVAEVRFCLGDQ
ncbi:MAG: DUF721 domain-containing protein [Candidatus Brocadiia bacterium]